MSSAVSENKRMQRILTIYAGRKQHAAKLLATATEAFDAAQTRHQLMADLIDEYLADAQARRETHAGVLRGTMMFYQQLASAHQHHELEMQRLADQLKQRRQSYRESAARQQALENLIAKRAADHEKQARKKAERGQVSRRPSKL